MGKGWCRGMGEVDATGVLYEWWLTIMTLEHLNEIGTRPNSPRFRLSRQR
jgi:hypothetical protein